jgi:hypothetical protein
MTIPACGLSDMNSDRDALHSDESRPLLLQKASPKRQCRHQSVVSALYLLASCLVLVLMTYIAQTLSLRKLYWSFIWPADPSLASQRHEPRSTPFPSPTVASQPGFASYLDYASKQQPIDITYDGRSFLLNGERTIFLSGSLHPVRATKATWSLALNEAVANGLNMITIYVMWSAHQPFENQPINWTLPMSSLACSDNVNKDNGKSCQWTLADALWAAAKRGLFVHIRLGPYVCAEYSYGGIPEWLPLKYPDMDM